MLPLDLLQRFEPYVGRGLYCDAPVVVGRAIARHR